MKRSKMLKLLDDTLCANGYVGDTTCSEEMASILLHEIEESGMLPPIEPYRTEYDLDLGVPEWESENEEV